MCILRVELGSQHLLHQDNRTDQLVWQGMRRQHEASATAKHGEEFRLQQAKRAAWARAQTAGAPGNYRNCDSQFGNYLIPVIPNQFFNKSPNSAPASPGSGGFAAPSITGNVGKTFG